MKKLLLLTLKQLDALALANTLALIDLILHPLFHLWGWIFPRSYEIAMSEFVIGLSLHVQETFEPKFLVFWVLEAVAFWVLGYMVATIYNKLTK